MTQKDVEFIKLHTSYDEISIKKWYEDFKQACPDGRINPDMFVNMCNALSSGSNHEQFCKHVFRAFDTDQNGYIDFRELLLFWNMMDTGSDKDKLKWAFRIYDIDGDGTISISEMTKVLQGIYQIKAQWPNYSV